MNKVAISDHFTYKKIFRLAIAPILMMVFISLYSIVDGICIINLPVDEELAHDAFAGANLIYPITTIVGGIGLLLGTGGAALIGKMLGEKKYQLAKETFTNIVIAAAVVGLIFSIAGYFVVEPFAIAMSQVGKLSDLAVQEAIKYGQIIMLGQFIYTIQNMFQTLFVVDEKPILGFIFSVAAGVTNIVFDIIFIGPLQMGAVGAAIATIMGYVVGALGPVIYFIFNKSGNIYFVRGKFNIHHILKSANNGLSEFINFAAMSISGILFNYQLLRYYGNLGQTGVEVYGAITYVVFVFVAIFLGYSGTMAPVVSYNLGAKNKKELSNVLRKSLIIVGSISLVMFILGEALANPLSLLFSHGDQTMVEMMTLAMGLWSVSFLFSGFAIYGGSFFVGLNNGKIAFIISLARSVALVVLFVFVLPILIGPTGIWISSIGSEGCAAIFAIILIFAYRKRYEYKLIEKTPH